MRADEIHECVWQAEICNSFNNDSKGYHGNVYAHLISAGESGDQHAQSKPQSHGTEIAKPYGSPMVANPPTVWFKARRVNWRGDLADLCHPFGLTGLASR